MSSSKKEETHGNHPYDDYLLNPLKGIVDNEPEGAIGIKRMQASTSASDVTLEQRADRP